ncbi:MAG: 30S ribosomal protein S27ae [Nanoarchaeota archaeon]|nr:30S ribosomal protein S27ae [Nanoarchaeota archaeon]MBU1135845.1 30S ribosomal protein S27ae [Nanoarchaeota archaeon]MBU2519665.1 30S ribosomal protein S27ae [Nanoarchaeota archaeon]
MGKKQKKAVRKGKKQRTGRKHESLKTHSYYEIQGSSVSRKRRSCPRCGTGTWLAQHKNRSYCGKCAYSELDKKKAPETAEKPKENNEESKVEETKTDEPAEAEKKE